MNNNQCVSNGDRAWCKRCHRRETRGIRNTCAAKRSHLNTKSHQDAMKHPLGSSGIAGFGDKSPKEIAKFINEENNFLWDKSPKEIAMLINFYF